MSAKPARLLLSLMTLAVVLAIPATATAAPAMDYGSEVRCHYQVTLRNSHGEWSEAQLRRIAVTPPQMPAMASTETVGWRFVVTRSMNGAREEPYRVIYRSPIQRGTPTASGDDGFTTMRTDITLPGDPEGDRFVWYRVTLKMYWYAPDGSLQNKVIYLMPNMYWVIERHKYGPEDYCPGLETVEI